MNKGITFWQLLQGNDVVTVSVPVIQRDYAQGRQDKKAARVRENFLSSLVQHLEDGTPLGLDFVYGAKDTTKKVELIDGQQRFTTLFLLHIYFAIKDKVLQDHKETFLKFSYEVRDSAKEFCEKLIENGEKLDFSRPSTEKKDEIRDQIKDAIWFSDQWEQDPTVVGMLSMLEAIHSKGHFGDAYGMFAKLCDENCPVTFQFLSLEESEDCEDLYIKMNARGKPLTDYENFKALFGKWLEKQDTELAEKFWANVDGTWSQVFWNFISKRYNGANVDPQDWVYRVDLTMLSYLWQQVMVMVNALNPSKGEALPEFFDKVSPDVEFSLIDNSASSNQIEGFVDWNSGHKIGLLTPAELLVRSLQNAEAILDLMERLFIKDGAPIPLWLTNRLDTALFPVELAADTQAVKVIDSCTVSLRERLISFALIYWCCIVEEIPEKDSPEEACLVDYLRVVRNVLERYRSKKKGKWDPELDKKNFGSAANEIVRFLDPTKPCDEQLLDIERTWSNKGRFEEECEKTHCRQEDPSVAEPIRKMEDFALCKGSVEIFLHNRKPVLSDTYFAELMGQITKDPQKVCLAMLACAQDDKHYFRFLAGEGNNSERVMFAANLVFWPVGLQYEKDAVVFKNNKAAIKALADRYTALRDLGKDSTEVLDEIIATFLADCESNKRFGWRYYMIKYPEGFFGKKDICFSSGEKEIPQMPLMEFNPGNPFGCRTSAALRFREDASVNSFVLCAVYQWFANKGETPDDSFTAGTISTLQGLLWNKELWYEEDEKAFYVKKGLIRQKVEIKEDENLIEDLVKAIG